MLMILLLSFMLSCSAEADIGMAMLEALGCDKIELTTEEYTCYLNLSKNAMEAFGSVASSLADSMDSPLDNLPSNGFDNSTKAMYETMCINENCLKGAKKIITACKSVFQQFINLNILAVVDLLCHKNSNGMFCVDDLPDFAGFIPTACNSDKECNNDCKVALQNVSSTCCYPSMLSIFSPLFSPNQHYNQLWKSCELPTPQLCDLPSGSYSDDGSNDKDNSSSAGAFFFYVVAILLLTMVVLLLLIIVVKKARCKRRIFVDEDYTKVPFSVEDSDAI